MEIASSRGRDSNGDSSSGAETAMEIAAGIETVTATAAVGQCPVAKTTKSTVIATE